MTQQPKWPERIERVEATVLDLKPGDKLIVSPKEGLPSVAECTELKAFLEYWFPDARIVVVGLPVDLAVEPASEGGD